MPSKEGPLEPYFLAHIDEAGDPGIKTVAPIDPKGASEWFVVGCTVIRAANDRKTVELVQGIKRDIRSVQRPDLHYRFLNEPRKMAVCQAIAQAELRNFVVASNKRNMRGYRNPAAEALSMHPNDYFYNYCIRILLERVSAWCAHRSIKETGHPQPVKLIFSRRGRHSYRHVLTYLSVLQKQTEEDRLYQNARAIDFSVVDPNFFEVIEHQRNAGCQIADVVASAFFQATNASSRNWTTRYAEALKPRMASRGSAHVNFGVTLLPWSNWTLNLTDDQKSIFRFYGYAI